MPVLQWRRIVWPASMHVNAWGRWHLCNPALSAPAGLAPGVDAGPPVAHVCEPEAGSLRTWPGSVLRKALRHLRVRRQAPALQWHKIVSF